MDSKWTRYEANMAPMAADVKVDVIYGGGAMYSGQAFDSVSWSRVAYYRVCDATSEPSYEWFDWAGAAESPLPAGTRVMVHTATSDEVGPMLAEIAHWPNVRAYRRVAESEGVRTLQKERDDALALANKRRVEVEHWSGHMATMFDALRELCQQNDIDVSYYTESAVPVDSAVRNMLVSVRDYIVRQTDVIKLANTRVAELEDTVTATRTAMDSAINLERVFHAESRVREARTQRDTASCMLDLMQLRAALAGAVSRGELTNETLREWTKP